MAVDLAAAALDAERAAVVWGRTPKGLIEGRVRVNNDDTLEEKVCQVARVDRVRWFELKIGRIFLEGGFALLRKIALVLRAARLGLGPVGDGDGRSVKQSN